MCGHLLCASICQACAPCWEYVCQRLRAALSQQAHRLGGQAPPSDGKLSRILLISCEASTLVSIDKMHLGCGSFKLPKEKVIPCSTPNKSI